MAQGIKKVVFLSIQNRPHQKKSRKNYLITTGHDLEKKARFPTMECLAGSCIVWRASVGWKGESELAKERLPFWGKVWYNGMAEGKDAAGRAGRRMLVYRSPAAGSL